MIPATGARRRPGSEEDVVAVVVRLLQDAARVHDRTGHHALAEAHRRRAAALGLPGTGSGS